MKRGGAMNEKLVEEITKILKNKIIAYKFLEAKDGIGKSMTLSLTEKGARKLATAIAEKIEEILDVLEDMAYQHCWDEQNNEFDSFAISSNASTLRLLAKYGRIKIVKECGRRVIAKPIEKEEK